MKVQQIANKFGITPAERYAEETFFWDGRTIALMANPDYRMKDEDILHEISHWIVATEEERALPEYGMRSRPGETSPHPLQIKYRKRMTVSLTREEQNLREMASQIINKVLGMHYGILSVFGFDWDTTEELITKSKTSISPDEASLYLVKRGINIDEFARSLTL